MDRSKILAFALGPVLAAGLSFISLPLSAWFFTREDIGRNNVFQIFISFSLLVFTLGLDSAYVREFHDSNARFSLFKACLIPGLSLLIVTLVVSLPFASKLSNFLYGDSAPFLYLITAGCVILNFIARFFSLMVRMQERGGVHSVSQVFPKLVVIIMLIGYMICDVEHVYSNLLYTNFISTLLVALILAWNIRTDWPLIIHAKVNRAELKKLFSFGAPLIGAGIAYAGLNATSTVALRFFSDFKELGIYAMAMSFGGVAMIFQAIFSTVWMPIVYKWLAAKEDLRKIDAISHLVLFTVCCIFAIVGMFSWLVDLILPVEYAQVKYILVCCMAQPLLYTLSETTVVGLNIQRKSMYTLGIAVFSLLCNVLLSFILVPRFGATGAAVANALAYVAFFVARTETSAKLWRPILSAKLYSLVIGIVFLAIFMALTAADKIIFSGLIWLPVLMVLPIIFRSNLVVISNMIIKK